MPTSKVRIESDSLGDVEVPGRALYGAQTQRAIDNFPVSGLRFPRSFIRSLGLVKHACALANGELGSLDRRLSKGIAEAAFAVAEGHHDAHFPVDIFQTGSGTSTNMNANEVIAAIASHSLGLEVHPNDHVNCGQSSNDVIPTCIHLSASLELTERLIPALTQLATAIDAKSNTLHNVVKTGRTHLMDAMPLTFAQELSGWSAQIRKGINRLHNTLPRLCEVALGGTAVGTGINTHQQFARRACAILSESSTLSMVPNSNYFEALSCQDTALELSGQLKTLAASLMKISNDLRWMNSGPHAGLGEITLNALQPGSSIMPGKVNPVIPEAVAMVAAQVMGNDTTITIAAQSGNFQLNVMLPVIAYNLLQSLGILAQSAQLLATRVIADFQINQEAVSAALHHNPILVTALAPTIGYEKCAAIVQQAISEKRSLIAVAKQLTNLDEATLTRLLDPLTLVGGADQQPN